MNWSDGSASSLTENFGTNGKGWNWKWVFLNAAPLQIQALYICQACYTLQGDSHLIFTEDKELKKINVQSIWDSPMRRVNILVDRVFTLMKKVMYHSAIDKNELQDEVDADERNVADAKNTLDPAKVDESNA